MTYRRYMYIGVDDSASLMACTQKMKREQAPLSMLISEKWGYPEDEGIIHVCADGEFVYLNGEYEPYFSKGPAEYRQKQRAYARGNR